MSDPVTAVNLDWVRYTQMWQLDDVAWYEKKSPSELLRRALELSVMPIEAFKPTGAEIRPLLNYNKRYELNCGTISFHTERPEQRIMVDLTGADCAHYRKAGVTDEDILENIRERGARITRVDIACDFYGQGNPLDLRDAYRSGHCQTKVTTTTEVVDRKQNGAINSSTVYFGAAQSDKRLRVYDKQAQMQTKQAWIRIEATLKGDACMAALNAFKGHSVPDVGRAIIRGIFDTDSVKWWVKATTGPVIELEPIGRLEHSTDKWLLGIVRDVFERRLRETMAEDDFTIRNAFYDTIEQVRKDLFDN